MGGRTGAACLHFAPPGLIRLTALACYIPSDAAA